MYQIMDSRLSKAAFFLVISLAAFGSVTSSFASFQQHRQQEQDPSSSSAITPLLERRLSADACIDEPPERILIYTAQKSGASLLCDALGQFPRTVTLNLYPGKHGPEQGHLPRPSSAFAIYARAHMKEFTKQYPDTKKEELFKIMGDKYFGLPEHEQKPWKAKEVASALPENKVMSVVKATTNPWTLGWEYVSGLAPDAKILFVRHPAHLVNAIGYLEAPNEKVPMKKLKQLDRAYAARETLFNVTILYEDLMMNQKEVMTSLTKLGFCPKSVAEMLSYKHYTTADMVKFNLEECDWCERTKWKEWDAKSNNNKIVLNTHFIDRRPSKEEREIAAKVCPELTALYNKRFPKL